MSTQKSFNPTQFTAKDLGEILQFDPTTIRSWGRKPIPGEIYDPEAVNNEFIRNKIAENFEDDKIVELCGCHINEIEIIKSAKGAGKSVKRLEVTEMVVGEKYLLISHVYKHEFKLAGICEINGENVYLFELLKACKSTQDKYRALSTIELTTGDRWQIRELA